MGNSGNNMPIGFIRGIQKEDQLYCKKWFIRLTVHATYGYGDAMITYITGKRFLEGSRPSLHYYKI